MSDLRIQLIEQMCRLPEAQLARVQEFLARLNEGDGENRSPSPELIHLARHKDWPHAPVHRLSEHGTYIVTAATRNKQHFFRGEELLTMLQNELLKLAKHYGVILEAWAIFSNHYHFVGHTTGTNNQLPTLLSHLHTCTAAEVNRHHGTPGRDIWFNYWDTRLTFEKSYFARLNYVHQNPVMHGLVQEARDYRWCSAAWFESCASPSQIKTVYSFKINRVHISDDYAPV